MFRFYILTDGSVYIRESLLIIQFRQKISKMTPVIQLVHFVQTACQSCQCQNTWCNVNVQNRLIKVTDCLLECIVIADSKCRFDFLMIVSESISLRFKISVVSQSSKSNIGGEYLLQCCHL